MANVNVIVRALYKIIAVASSVMMVTQLKIAPAIIPLPIIGIVINANVFSFEEPRLIEASSMVIGICCKIATDERIVYGMRRMTKATTIMVTVPVKTTG
jgi:hypothetical protein